MVSHPLRRAAAWVSVAGFMALLVAPLVGHAATRGPDVSQLENRVLATRPELGEAVADWPGFPGRVNAWLNDRFGFRNALLALYVRLDEEVGTAGARAAVRGDDGWLFGALGDSLRSHQGRLPYWPGEAEAWLDAVAAIGARAEAAGAAFFVLAPPDKQTVYPERLSAYPRSGDSETRLETLTQLAPARGLAFVNPTDALVAAKEEGAAYFKTDTHWNDRGAYAGYRALAEAIQAQGVAIDVLPEERLSWRRDEGFVGDIYGLLGDANGAPETVDRAVIAEPTNVVETVELPQFTWRSFASSRVVMERAERPSILVLGDSFSYGLMAYLQESFGEVAFVHHQFGAFSRDAIEPEHYDVVVFVMVERHLNQPLDAPGAVREP